MAGTLAAIFGQLLLGWLLADFMTGAFHWWEDRFGNESWPLIGQWLIAPNRLHHAEPLAFAQHGFLERNAAAIVATGVVLATLALAFGLSAWLLTFALGGALANEVHRYAHQPSAAPAWLRVLQDMGVCQSPKEHAAHHRPPHAMNFCVLTDWLNPPLEAIGFWRRVEALIGRAG